MHADSMSVSGSEGAAVVTAPPALDASNARIVWHLVSEAFARSQVVVIDLTATRRCDLHGLTALLMARRLARDCGDVRLVPSPAICGMLAASSARMLFPVFPSVAAALQWPSGPGATAHLLRSLNGLTPSAYAAFADGLAAAPVNNADGSREATATVFRFRASPCVPQGPYPVTAPARGHHHQPSRSARRSARGAT